jgi:hypothetical protein
MESLESGSNCCRGDRCPGGIQAGTGTSQCANQIKSECRPTAGVGNSLRLINLTYPVDLWGHPALYSLAKCWRICPSSFAEWACTVLFTSDPQADTSSSAIFDLSRLASRLGRVMQIRFRRHHPVWNLWTRSRAGKVVLKPSRCTLEVCMQQVRAAHPHLCYSILFYNIYPSGGPDSTWKLCLHKTTNFLIVVAHVPR